MELPGYNFLSAPLWLITVLHWVTLTVHFVAMNFVVGGIVALLWGKFTNRWEDDVVKRFVKLLPSAWPPRFRSVWPRCCFCNSSIIVRRIVRRL